ncbi:hypothetical protein GCM10009559_81930 [Pseudonocardia zijingensis]|uniref:Uncharacterized protein n=1 Tax=Pseudonocardia zijingensis TaxID=153376 RepID=A0ABN1NLH2_9PSEU
MSGLHLASQRVSEPSDGTAYLDRHGSSVAQLDRGCVEHMGNLPSNVGIADPWIPAHKIADQMKGARLGGFTLADRPGTVVATVARHRDLLLDHRFDLRVRQGKRVGRRALPPPGDRRATLTPIERMFYQGWLGR